jgi:hypothetical protein
MPENFGKFAKKRIKILYKIIIAIKIAPEKYVHTCTMRVLEYARTKFGT